MIPKCCFIGCSQEELSFGFNEKDERYRTFNKVLEWEILKMITQKQVMGFISSMAIGANLYAGQMIVLLKKTYSYLTLECALPYETQSNDWSDRYRERYFTSIEMCDKETMLKHHYEPGCVYQAYCYMIDKSTHAISFWDGSENEIGQAVKYALNKKLEVININPKTFMIESLSVASQPQPSQPPTTICFYK